MTKCGYVGLVGRPNAGKSTLLNAILGQKIAGVSAKPQTTRNKIVGIHMIDDAQLLFIDTPGLHKNKKNIRINAMMNKEAWSALDGADAVLYLIDIMEGWDNLDAKYLEGIIQSASCPVAVVISKVDRMKNEEVSKFSDSIKAKIEAIVEEKGLSEQAEKYLHNEIFEVSAKQKETFGAIERFIVSFLPEGPWLYPESDLTNRPQKFVVGEIIREKVFRSLGEELPYNTAVKIELMEFKKKVVNIVATIIVGRDSHKGMVIGKRGAKIKEIGMDSRKDLEKHFDKKVFLDLQVKVDSDWVEDASLIAEYASLDIL